MSRSFTSGAVEAKCRVVWRACVAILPPISNSLARSFFGSQRLAFVPVKAIIWVQVMSSEASMTTWHQSSLPANAWKGRFARPVSLALRILSSQRARNR